MKRFDPPQSMPSHDQCPYVLTTLCRYQFRCAMYEKFALVDKQENTSENEKGYPCYKPGSFMDLYFHDYIINSFLLPR